MVTRNGTVKRLPVETLKNLRNNGIRALRTSTRATSW